MSYKDIDVICPHCGHNQVVRVISNCNSIFEKEEEEKILNTSAFLARCNRCYQLFELTYDCVYLNPIKKFYVYLDKKESLLNSYKLVPGYRKADENGYRNYGATNPYDFINKIVSLNNNIDPRMAELALDITRERFHKDYPKEKLDNVFLAMPSKENKGKVSITLLVDNKTRFFSTSYPSSLFKQIPRSIKNKLTSITSLTFDRDDFLSTKDWTYKSEIIKE